MPAANAGLLAAAIPGSKLELWPRASHVYPTDEPEAEADRSVARFLAEAEGGPSWLVAPHCVVNARKASGLPNATAGSAVG